MYITKITAYPAANGLLEVVKTVDDPRIGTVTDKTPLTLTALDKWLRDRKWYYNGRRGGGFQYLPSQRATRLKIGVESAS